MAHFMKVVAAAACKTMKKQNMSALIYGDYLPLSVSPSHQHAYSIYSQLCGPPTISPSCYALFNGSAHEMWWHAAISRRSALLVIVQRQNAVREACV